MNYIPLVFLGVLIFCGILAILTLSGIAVTFVLGLGTLIYTFILVSVITIVIDKINEKVE